MIRKWNPKRNIVNVWESKNTKEDIWSVSNYNEGGSNSLAVRDAQIKKKKKRNVNL